MRQFSLSGQSEIMRTKMLEDRYVLDKIAILGQATTVYSKPNTGKTLLVLLMLIQSIKMGRLKGENVYYINADDDYKGLVFKTELAEKYGFHMLSPSHKDFESAALLGYMAQMIADDTARGAVVILDTLKKFVDPMDKKSGREFMTSAREFVSNGGTLIMLACQTAWKNGQGIRENSVENCPP
jgi:archaellum biogenesis ATPase FlaH